MRALTYLLALAVAPLLYGLAFPPWSLWGLAWIALVPWLVALRLVSTTTRAVLITCATTLVASSMVAGWLPAVVADYLRAREGVPPFVVVWLVTVAPAAVVFTLCYRAAASRRGASIAFVAGAAWAGTEFARVGLGGVPFGLLGYSQVAWSSLVQVADVTGVYGVGFVVAAANAALAELWLAAAGASRPWAAAGAVVTALAALALCLGYEALRGEPEADGPPQRVAVVQANVDLDDTTLAEYLDLTQQSATPRRPALVVWPEGAMTFLVEDEPRYRDSIARVVAPADLELVAGGVRVDRSGTPRYYDSAFLLAPTGDVAAHYDKEQLLPFAEYAPFGARGILEREISRVRELTPGAATPPLPARVAALGVVVGNEVMLPHLLAARVAAGAELLTHVSSAAWFGDPRLSLQLLDMARLRAIEQRRDLVCASASGPSAIIDARGGIVAMTAPLARGTAAGTVHRRAQRSFYATVGDGFAIACAAVVVLELLSALRRHGRRPPKDGAAPTIELPARKRIGT